MTPNSVDKPTTFVCNTLCIVLYSVFRDLRAFKVWLCSKVQGIYHFLDTSQEFWPSRAKVDLHLGPDTPWCLAVKSGAKPSGIVTHTEPNSYLSHMLLPPCLQQGTLEHEAKSCPPLLESDAFGTDNVQWHHLRIHLESINHHAGAIILCNLRCHPQYQQQP